MGACLQANMEREGMMVQSIYYGKIGRAYTERLLERYGREGSFLLRDSESVQGAYCLCVRKTPFVHTYRLLHTPDGWSLQQDSGDSLQCFGTLEALIDSYRRGVALSDTSIPPLTNPLDKTQLGDSSLESVVRNTWNKDVSLKICLHGDVNAAPFAGSSGSVSVDTAFSSVGHCGLQPQADDKQNT